MWNDCIRKQNKKRREKKKKKYEGVISWTSYSYVNKMLVSIGLKGERNIPLVCDAKLLTFIVCGSWLHSNCY